jgi:hypothetical protein
MFNRSRVLLALMFRHWLLFPFSPLHATRMRRQFERLFLVLWCCAVFVVAARVTELRLRSEPMLVMRHN